MLFGLEELAEARDRVTTPWDRLVAVLRMYAAIAHESHGHHDAELAALLHRDERVARAEHQLQAMVGDLIREAAAAGDVRSDVSPGELAAYCLHAIGAAGRLGSRAAVGRLVDVTLRGLSPDA